jgi:membrane-associated phospholipid phosphatase
MWNNAFNLFILEWLHQYASLSVGFNRLVYFLQGAYVVKGFSVLGLLWYFWFRDTDPASRTRRIVLGAFIGCLVSLLIARWINNVAPYQPRPFANEALALSQFIGLPIAQLEGLRDINTFPSDHGAMFMSLAMGIYLISKKAGTFAFVYVFALILLPRLYLGLHYPTDIIAGGLLGIACTAIACHARVMRSYEQRMMQTLAYYPAGFQTFLLLLTFELSVMFIDVRSLIKVVMQYLL